jgi:hypothetical protein
MQPYPQQQYTQQQYQPSYPVPTALPQPVSAPAAVPAMPTFVDPTAGSGGSGLKLRNLVNRFCAVTVTGADPSAMFQGKPNPSVTLTVVVFDGPVPLNFGDDRLKQLPAQWAIDTLPYEASGVISSHVNIVSTCMPHVGTGAVLLGVFEYGITSQQGNSKPINFRAVDPSDPRRQVAAQWFGAKLAGQVVNPTPRPLTPEAAAQAQQGQPGMAPPQQQFMPPAQPVGQVSYVQPAPAGLPNQQAPMQIAANGTSAAPAGWDPTVWASIPEPVKQQILAQQQGQQPAATPGM